MSLLDISGNEAFGHPLGTLEGSGVKSSALSTKITSLLSASYADIELKDALATLDSRKFSNTAETRRNLRRDVQKELIAANAEIVYDFGAVAQQLRSVGEALSNLQNTCADIRKHVSFARTETKPMLEEASSLMVQRAQVETKQQVLTAFTSHFLLSDNELRTLTSGAEPVDDEFFQVLVKAKRIHQDCQTLLSSNDQRLGLEILDQSTKNLNLAFQKLYRGVQREFKSLDLENPRINASVRRALRVLAERPTLFQNCLDTFAESRERTLSESFYNALTGRGQDSSSMNQKPIDFSAHEPLRYVGDMLAWAHSTTVSEREALESLFVSEGNEIAKGIAEDLESELWTRDSVVESEGEGEGGVKASQRETFDGVKALSQLVNRSLAGVAHLLSRRIDEVTASHDDAVLAYKIANLISFYHNIFTRLVSESGFLDALRGMEANALERFRTTMRSAVSSLQAEMAVSPGDLSPPDFLSPALDTVQALLKSYETSMTSGMARVGGETKDLDTGIAVIVSEALDPFLAICDALASGLAAPAKHIFTINCLQQTLDALTDTPSVRSLTGSRTTSLTMEIQKNSTALAGSTHGFLVSTSGLEPLLEMLAASSSLDEAARSEPFAPEALSLTSAQLDAFLPSAVMDAEGVLSGLRSRDILREVVRMATEAFVADFERVDKAVLAMDDAKDVEVQHDEGHESDEEGLGFKALFPRTAEEVRVLLS